MALISDAGKRALTAVLAAIPTNPRRVPMGVKTMLRAWLFDKSPADETIEQALERILGPTPSSVRDWAGTEIEGLRKDLASLRQELDVFSSHANLSMRFTRDGWEKMWAECARASERDGITAEINRVVRAEIGKALAPTPPQPPESQG